MAADNKAIVRRLYEEVWIKRKLEAHSSPSLRCVGFLSWEVCVTSAARDAADYISRGAFVGL